MTPRLSAYKKRYGLNARQLLILTMLGADPWHTKRKQKDVAAELGISAGRVHSIYKQAQAKLRLRDVEILTPWKAQWQEKYDAYGFNRVEELPWPEWPPKRRCRCRRHMHICRGLTAAQLMEAVRLGLA